MIAPEELAACVREDRLRLQVVAHDDGLWTITSPDARGLVLAGPDLDVLLCDVPAAIAKLRELNGEAQQ